MSYVTTAPTFAVYEFPTSAKMNALADGIQAAWTPYTPALVNLSIGNGTRSAGWLQVGKTVDFRVRILFGSTTTIGGAVTIGLPTAVGSVPQIAQCFVGSSSGTVPLVGAAYLADGAVDAQPFHPATITNGTQERLGSVALTMGTSAYVMLQGTYERA